MKNNMNIDFDELSSVLPGAKNSAKIEVLSAAFTIIADALSALAIVEEINEVQAEEQLNTKNESNNNRQLKNMQKQLDFIVAKLDRIERKIDRH
ncbi:hypothetical protein MHH85_13315 [Viridibacillus sp. FSL E2-0187]|uniref:hypothetical protein n=1 Tax=Viridibacillus TaxID=496496 RepID=UPI00187B91A6|nr:hypothetical protein [Viridibacillus sp. JNUCC-6]QOV11168.1 hypothetical protein JNUCC6_21875 [Viridibacillus sp. JNUCC-6]